MLRSLAPWVLATGLPTLLGACGHKTSADPPPAATETATSTLLAQPGAEANLGVGEQDLFELRRGYGVVDMRYDSCVTAEGDQVLLGKGCKAGFVVYGPYVSIPAKSDIEVTFDIQPSQKVEVYADIVSQMGKQGLAGLNSQIVDAGVTRRFGYKVHVFGADQFVESRIGIRAAGPVEFAISNYTMTVR